MRLIQGKLGGAARVNTKQEVAELDRFLADNPELHRLSAKLSIFNLFDVLRIADAEIRHSNVLAWLLDPAENHGLRETFLRRFLSRCLLLNQGTGSVDVPLTAAQVELADLRSAEVRREYRHIDVLVLIPEKRWLIAIENKVRGHESPGQLKRYRKSMEIDYPEWEKVAILLTLSGDDPSSDGLEAGFIPFSHEEVVGILHELLGTATQLPDATHLFIEQYIETLERLTMSDPEIVELCRTIYSRHRKAIDLIVEYGLGSQVSEYVHSVLEEDESMPTRILDSRSGSTWFIPLEWEDHLEMFESDWRSAVPYGIACWFSHPPRRDKVAFLIEVLPISPSEERKRLVQALDQAGFRVAKQAYRDEAKFTRIYTEYRTWPEEDKFEDTMRTLWKKGSKQAKKVTEVLKSLES
jgi:hypothetical protein